MGLNASDYIAFFALIVSGAGYFNSVQQKKSDEIKSKKDFLKNITREIRKITFDMQIDQKNASLDLVRDELNHCSCFKNDEFEDMACTIDDYCYAIVTTNNKDDLIANKEYAIQAIANYSKKIK